MVEDPESEPQRAVETSRRRPHSLQSFAMCAGLQWQSPRHSQRRPLDLSCPVAIPEDVVPAANSPSYSARLTRLFAKPPCGLLTALLPSFETGRAAKREQDVRRWTAVPSDAVRGWLSAPRLFRAWRFARR